MSGYGYLYRRDHLTEQQLRDLLQHTVFGTQPVFAFAASSVELQPIRSYLTVEDVPLTGERGSFEFGHIFSSEAEVRWKVDDRDRYDALVLNERPIPALQGEELLPPASLAAVEAPREAAIFLTTPADEQRRGIQWRLGYVEYRASNGAVQLVRYTHLEKEQRR